MPTPVQPTPAPVFRERDLRDPLALGELLLALQKRKAPLSRVYDRNTEILERVPQWTGDGLMSNDPALHHSRTPQTPAPIPAPETQEDK